MSDQKRMATYSEEAEIVEHDIRFLTNPRPSFRADKSKSHLFHESDPSPERHENNPEEIIGI